jgi:hypothetical protein
MPSKLTKRVVRQTQVEVYDRRKHRPIIVSIEPAGHDNAVIGLRLSGTRDTYRLGVQTILNMAIRKHHDDVERDAKKIQKDEQLPRRSALAKARKKAEKELKK